MTDLAEWQKKWIEQVELVQTNVSYENSAEQLRRLIKTGLLRFTDAKSHPDKFFLAHRLLVRLGSPGFCIRFTVQFNLFAGTVLGLGGPEQIDSLDDMQTKGLLGCFALTEKLAGVNSGLIVQTTATWSKEKQLFILNSPTEGSQKNWISQGLVADKATVIADLKLDGKSYGPHGFLIDLREENGKVKRGILLGDMGRKTTGNDLDNAYIRFDSVEIPKNSLLNKFAEIHDNKYVQTTKEKMRIEVIGQRLLTGRIAIAQAALMFCRNLFIQTKQYTDKKKCWVPGGDAVLGSIPHIAALYSEADRTLAYLDEYCMTVEYELSKYLLTDEIPSSELVEAIAVAKIAATENAILLSFRLKQEVGSYALMGGNGFEHFDFLQCCKFAEGDGRILQQKLARDGLKRFAELSAKGITSEFSEEETKLCLALGMGGKLKWDENFRLVYSLAEEIQARTMKKWTGKSFPLQKSFL